MGWFTKWLRAQPPLTEAETVQVDAYGEAVDPNLAANLADVSENAQKQKVVTARTELFKLIRYAADQGETFITIFGHRGNKAEFANLNYLRRCGFRTVKDGRSSVRICWGPEADFEEPYVGCDLPPEGWLEYTPRPMPGPMERKV